MNALEYTREYQKKIPFLSHLKILTEELGEGTAKLSLPVEKHLTNSMGTVHGGVIMSLLDIALCTAARTLHPGFDRGDHHRHEHLLHRRRHRRQAAGRGTRPEGWAYHELRRSRGTE